MSLNNDLKGLNELLNWYQSLVAHDLGSYKRQFCNAIQVSFDVRLRRRTLTLKITCSCLQWCDEDLSKSSKGLITTEEKAQKKNDIKARSMLLMALHNEHQLTFNQYKDAKTLFDAIQIRFGGNDATRKTQKTLLKQILDTIFNRLQKIISHTNEVNTANVQVSTVDSPDSTANLSDATVYAFLENQPNGSQLVHEDLEQIHEDDLEEMDLKWQLALLSIRARRGPRNQDNRNRNQDSSRRNVSKEETSSKAMVAIDGAGFNWSFMADEEVPTNMALMAFSESEKNEVMFCDQIAVLKRDTSFKDSEINALKRSQISDNIRKHVGFVSYNVVPPPRTCLFAPPTIDLSNSGLKEFQQPEFEGYGPKASMSVCKDTSNKVKKTPDAPLDEKLAHCNYHQREGMVNGNNYTRVNYNYSAKMAYPNSHKNMNPRAVLRKTSLKLLNTARLILLRPQHVGFRDLPNLTVHPQKEDQGYVDSGCSRHMTGNMSYLIDFKEFDGGYVTFGGGARGGRITGKGTLKTGKLDFEDVYFVKELQFNLFSVSQMCDKKNSVLFTDTACFVLSPDFKLPDESQVLLKVPRKNNMYNVDMKNIVPKKSLTYFVAKATLDESMLWHRRLGHINFKTINKLVKDNLVRGLPAKRFENDQTCVVCLKGKQHKDSCKSKIHNSITQPLFKLHMDVFGPTFMSSLMNKKYCLVVTDDFSRFSWVFFLASKDETM
ncbi:putative ribonuclease H-like domain-containing protein [Tanacetum coccineum]